MRRAGDAVGDDVVRLAALRLMIEMHHLLGEPHVLRGERVDDSVDMLMADLDLLAVHDVLAIEHDAVAERAADPVLMRGRADHHQFAQRIDQRLRHGGRRRHGLNHPRHDHLDRQQGLALIEFACRLERSDQGFAARVARLGEEGIVFAVDDFEVERLVGRADETRDLARKLDGETDGIEPARLDLARARDLDTAEVDRRRVAQHRVEPLLEALIDGVPPRRADELPIGGEAAPRRLLESRVGICGRCSRVRRSAERPADQRGQQHTRHAEHPEHSPTIHATSLQPLIRSAVAAKRARIVLRRNSARRLTHPGKPAGPRARTPYR